jgi:hypothetical protein
MKTLTDDIVTHIAKFDGLVLRTQQLNVKPDESSLMVKLLDSPPDEFEGLRQAWWARPESQQTVNNLIEVLTSEEKRRQQRAEKQDDLVALFASKAKMQGKNECGQTSNQNLSTETKKTSNYNGNKVSRIRCYFCGNIGHIRRNCKKRKSSSTASKDESKDEAFICETLNAEEDDVWNMDSRLRSNRSCVTSKGMVFCSEVF